MRVVKVQNQFDLMIIELNKRGRYHCETFKLDTFYTFNKNPIIKKKKKKPDQTVVERSRII